MSEPKDLDIQTLADGEGARFHRTYSVDLPVSFESALTTMKAVKADPNAFSPNWIATFEKTTGAAGVLKVGDEFMVHLSAPWVGPVRVSEQNETSFSLLTLDGHIEAGQIRFRLHRNPDGRAHFEIESVTRSRDKVVDFLYDKMRLAMFAQSEMWALFCRNFAEKAMGRSDDLPEVKVHTERQDPETGCWSDVSDQLGAHGI